METQTEVIVAIKTPELEALVRQHLESGRFKEAEDVILQALRCSEAEEAKCQEERQAIDRLKTFGKIHRLSLGGIIIRELINEGRR